MKRILIIALVGLAALLVVNGCSNKELEQNYQQASTQVAAQSDTLQNLRAELNAKTDSLQAYAQTENNADTRIQTLTQENQKSSRTIAGLKRTIDEKDQAYQDLKVSSTNEIYRRDSLLAEIHSVFADTNITLADVRDQLGNQQVMSQVKSDFINNIKPWYSKYKHDATHRNFLQVLFASGKAKKPTNPEPSFETLNSTLDSLSTKPTAPTTPGMPDTTQTNPISMQSGS